MANQFLTLKALMFCQVKQPAEYRRALQNRQGLGVVVSAVGVATLVFALLGVPKLLAAANPSQQDFFGGFYSGLGAALAVCGALLYARSRKLLGNEATFRAAFTELSDERNQAIANQAARMAGLVLVFILYGILLVAGLFWPVLFGFCVCAVVAYCLLLLAFWVYYNHKL